MRWLFSLLFTTVVILLSHKSGALNLSEAYKMALTKDPSLKVAQEEYLAGLEERQISYSALLPQISLQGAYQKQKTDSREVSLLTDETLERDNDQVIDGWRLSVQQAIYDTSQWYNYKRGKFQAFEARHQWQLQKQLLMLRLITSYIGVIQAQDNLELAKKLEESDKKQLSNVIMLTKKKNNKNSTKRRLTEVDIYQAQASYDASTAMRLNNEDIVGQSKDALMFIIGNYQTPLWRLADNFSTTQIMLSEPYQWVQIALANNPTIKAAQARKDAARAEYKSAKLARRPSVYLELQHQERNTEATLIENLSLSDLRSREIGSSISMNLSVPIYNGGLISSRRRQAEHQFKASEKFYSEIVANITRQIVSTYRSAVITINRINIIAEAVASSKKALDVQEQAYQKNIGDINDVLRSRQTYYDTLRLWQNSRYDYIIKFITLKSLVGTLSSKDLDELNNELVKKS